MRILLITIAIVLVAGCGDDDGGTDASMLDGAIDSSVDSGVELDSGVDSAIDAATDASMDSAADAGPLLMHDCTPTHFATSDADGSGDGSAEQPWTLHQAMADAQPGDVVVVSPGVYTATGTGTRYTPAWNPARSGSEDAPIVFCAEYPAVHNDSNRTELRHDGTDEGGPTFGTLERDWIVWDGFYVDEAMSASRPDTGPVGVWGSEHVTIARSVIQGATIERADNHNGIRLEFARHVRIVDNLITGVDDVEMRNRNHAAIMTYDSSFITIEHNEITDCHAGMYLKGDHADDGAPNGAYTVRFNHVHDVRAHAITVLGIVPVGDAPSDISHNLLERAGVGVLLNSVAADHPASVRLHHNTIVDTENGIFVNTSNPSDFHITQNLIVGSPVFVTDTLSREDVLTMVGNGYLSDDNHAHDHDYWAFGDALEVFQEWSGLGAESSTGDPLFVNPSMGDYHLGAGSPAATASSGGEAVGCYVDGTEHMGPRPAE